MNTTSQCRLCGSTATVVFEATVLKKHVVKYYRCPRCEIIQTEEPYWLDEAYKNPINHSDTGLLSRNIGASKAISLMLYFFYDRKAKFLDYAGGYGVFTRLMRDLGFDFYWSDPTTPNLLSSGFEFDPQAVPYELVTSLESFEHFTNPKEEIEKILHLSRNIIFSTFTTPSPIPERDWWYYGFEHGQHIAFYSPNTLLYIASNYNLQYYACGDFHLFTEKKLNPLIIRIVYKLRKYGLNKLVNRTMKSKTWSDSQLLIHSDLRSTT